MKILAAAAGGEHVLAADSIDPTLDWILGINVDNPFCGPAMQPGPAQSSCWVPATEGVAGWGPTQDINTGDRDTACVPSIMPLWAGPDSCLRSLRTAIGGNAHSARDFSEVYPSVVPRSSGRPELPPLHIARSLSPSSYAGPEYSPYAGPDQPPSTSQSACPTACTTPTTIFDSPPRCRARVPHAASEPVAGTRVAPPSSRTLPGGPACALTTGVYDRPPARCLSCPASSCPSSSILDKSTSDSSETLPRKISLALSDPGYYSASDHSFYCTSGPVDSGYYSPSGPADSPVGANIISASMLSMSPPPSPAPSPDSDPQQKPLRPFVQDEAGNWHRKRVREMTPDELVRFRELNRAIGRRQRARSKARMEALSRRVLTLRDESVELHSTIDTLAHRVLDLKMAVLQRLAARDPGTRSALGLP